MEKTRKKTYFHSVLFFFPPPSSVSCRRRRCVSKQERERKKPVDIKHGLSLLRSVKRVHGNFYMNLWEINDKSWRCGRKEDCFEEDPFMEMKTEWMSGRLEKENIEINFIFILLSAPSERETWRGCCGKRRRRRRLTRIGILI